MHYFVVICCGHFGERRLHATFLPGPPWRCCPKSGRRNVGRESPAGSMAGFALGAGSLFCFQGLEACESEFSEGALDPGYPVLPVGGWGRGAKDTLDVTHL